MKLLGIVIGSLLGGVVGAGTSLLRPQTETVPYFNIEALCSARGGEWVHGSYFPLCMTPDEGLLQFVDGAFVPFDEMSSFPERIAAAREEKDPWAEEYIPLLAQKPVEYAQASSELQEQEARGTCIEEENRELYTGKKAKVDFSTWPDASRYRTAITKDVERGVNFAGSYVVSTWGCGTRRHACVGHAVVSLRTGEIMLYGIEGVRAGEFSMEKNQLTIPVRRGEERWSVQGERLVKCSD